MNLKKNNKMLSLGYWKLRIIEFFIFLRRKKKRAHTERYWFWCLALECSDSQHQAVHQVKINIDVNYCRWKNIYAFLIYPNSIKSVENYC